MHVEVNGVRLFIDDQGDGEPLLLLEGMGGDTLGWRRNIPHFADAGYRVVAFDFRGNGFSDKPEGPYGMRMFVEDALGVMDALGIGAAHLYGQSMGGFVALNIALDHPGRVRALVLGCTHAGGSSAVPARPAPGDDGPRALYARRTLAERPEHVAEDLRVAATVPRPREDLQVQVAREHDVAARLGEVRRSTLVVHGEDDRVVSPENARFLAERIPGAELFLVPDAGHLFHSELADLVDARIVEFLRASGRRSDDGVNETGRGEATS